MSEVERLRKQNKMLTDALLRANSKILKIKVLIHRLNSESSQIKREEAKQVEVLFET